MQRSDTAGGDIARACGGLYVGLDSISPRPNSSAAKPSFASDMAVLDAGVGEAGVPLSRRFVALREPESLMAAGRSGKPRTRRVLGDVAKLAASFGELASCSLVLVTAVVLPLRWTGESSTIDVAAVDVLLFEGPEFVDDWVPLFLLKAVEGE